MKTSDLIFKLQTLMAKHGDLELNFAVKDSYSNYGDAATMNLHVGDNSNIPNHFFGFGVNRDSKTITLSLNLDCKGETKPKITFRK